MLLKMLAIEKAARHTDAKHRQIYVTQSRVLAARVREHFYSLLETALRHNSGSKPESSNTTSQQKNNRRLLDNDDEDDTKDDLPASFSALTDKHFPLFVSFEKVRVVTDSSTHSLLFSAALLDAGRGSRNVSANQ
jgi:hypothetical protein